MSLLSLTNLRMTSLALATSALAIGTASGQLPIGDAEADKRTYLSQGNPTILVGADCGANALVGGVLWPTLVQIKSFLIGYVGGILCVTGGSEQGHTDSDTGRGTVMGIRST